MDPHFLITMPASLWCLGRCWRVDSDT